MKKVILFLAICLFGLSNSYAQKPAAAKQPVAAKATETPQQKTHNLITKMTTTCNLKPEQVDKLTKAYTEYYTKHDALKKQKDILDKSAYDDRSTALKKTRDTALKSTLTAAQYKQWTAAKDKEKKNAKKDKSEE